MPRRSTTKFRRGPRPRTAWVAMTPHSLVHTGGDSFDVQEIEIQDSYGPVPWGKYHGGTVLRTIMDIALAPAYDPALALLWSVQHYFHVGIFMTEDELPTATRWDPNVPHGDFMYREMAVETWYKRDDQSKSESSHGQRIHVDSTVKRRIREGERMWISSRVFDLGLEGGALGYAGRLLIQLP